MPLRKLHYLFESPINALDIKAATYEFLGDIIQSIAAEKLPKWEKLTPKILGLEPAPENLSQDLP